MCKLTAVLLAGGLGTRLRSALANRPKVLAEVGGYPFLKYLLDQLANWRIREAVLCTGYLGEQIKSQFGKSYKTVNLSYSQELSPLGTAGALRLALPLFNSDMILILNGDSYCKADIEVFWKCHCSRRSEATLLLVNSPDSGRYGNVQIAADGHIVKFVEKGERTGPGLINAGIYLIKQSLLERIPDTTPVSLEREIFPSWIGRDFYGFQVPGPFLDIGTPESYAAAEAFFARTKLQ